jgi:tetratricopeptide (TPR) repeat protein
VFEAVGDDRALGRAWMLAGWVRGGALGRHEEWLAATERALASYRRAGWPAATVIGHAATALYLGPTPVVEAIDRCRALLEFDVADLASEASVYAHLGGLHAMRRAFDDADACLERSRSIYVDLGRRPSLLTTWAPISARAAKLRGEPESAVDIYVATCEELVAMDAGFHLTTQAAELADLLCELGRFDEAETWAALAEQHARSADREGTAWTLIARGQLLAQRGDDDAEDRARAAVALADETDELNLRGTARLALAKVLERRGASGAAEERSRAASEYEAKGNVAVAQSIELPRATATSSADSG